MPPAGLVSEETIVEVIADADEQDKENEEKDGENDQSVLQSVTTTDETTAQTSTSTTPVTTKQDKETIDETTAGPSVSAQPITPQETSVISSKESPVMLADASTPSGSRWATAKVDLTGQWKIVVTDAFKQEYDQYLLQLGQPGWVRSIALGIISFTTEETVQSEEGRKLLIRATNARGVWERLMVASGTDADHPDYEPITVPVVTADGEKVQAEAWWEENGTVHRSWMRGVEKFGGGDFESRRYLEDDGQVLVCESTFHHQDTTIDDTCVTWRFQRATE